MKIHETPNEGSPKEETLNPGPTKQWNSWWRNENRTKTPSPLQGGKFCFENPAPPSGKKLAKGFQCIWRSSYIHEYPS